jgi:hypothetical protein
MPCWYVDEEDGAGEAGDAESKEGVKKDLPDDEDAKFQALIKSFEEQGQGDLYNEAAFEKLLAGHGINFGEAMSDPGTNFGGNTEHDGEGDDVFEVREESTSAAVQSVLDGLMTAEEYEEYTRTLPPDEPRRTPAVWDRYMQAWARSFLSLLTVPSALFLFFLLMSPLLCSSLPLLVGVGVVVIPSLSHSIYNMFHSVAAQGNTLA